MYAEYFNTAEGYGLLGGFNSVFISNNAIDADKTVSFPNGWNFDTNLSFKVLFKYGHNCANDSTPMTLNGIAVVVNKYGTLIPLPIHEMDDNGTPVYKSLQPNTILEMYYTDNYDGSDTPAYVIIGNPIVLSDTDYTIYADGNIGKEVVGTVKAMSTNNIPYGWLEANGQAISRIKYSDLFIKYETQTYDSDSTHTLLSKYGVGDGSTTFNLPDYREVALVGVGTNGTDGLDISGHSHDEYLLGEFKDDQLQDHYHRTNGRTQGTGHKSGNEWPILSPDGNTANATTIYSGRHGVVTRGKRKGVTYLIKVL